MEPVLEIAKLTWPRVNLWDGTRERSEAQDGGVYGFLERKPPIWAAGEDTANGTPFAAVEVQRQIATCGENNR
jgi:hypothetical protein